MKKPESIKASADPKGYLVRVEGEPWPRPFVKNDGTAGIAATITNPMISIVVRRPSRQNQGQGGFQGGPATSGAPQTGGWPSGDANGTQNADFGRAAFDDEQPF